MDFLFDLQLFGGKGGTSTTVEAYKPSDEERRMYNQQANYAEAVSPNALELNNIAMDLLQDSLGTVQVDYNTMNQNAQNQIASAMGNMAALADSNNKSLDAANNSLTNIRNQTGTLAGNTSAAYGRLSGNYIDAANKANETLGQLAQGYVPSAYQQNMENSIASALTNTMGKTINNLGNRGVLNSSVTNEALNDIERNAADTVAQQYQQNINQAAGLTQQQYGNTTDMTNSLGDIIGKQYSVNDNALTQQGQLTQQMFDNTQNNNSQNSGIYSNLINSATAPIEAAAMAQESAISPARDLWSASLGLNGAGNQVLGAISGKWGTRTTQQTVPNNGGMGFLSGLINAGATLYACFTAGTQVTMADGKKKEIQEIKEGDRVRTLTGSAKVVKVMEPKYNDVVRVICENAVTTTTDTQPLMGEDGNYILVSDLKLGTKLKDAGRVLGLLCSGRQTVYDFETDGDNQYIADGFIAMGGGSEIWR